MRDLSVSHTRQAIVASVRAARLDDDQAIFGLWDSLTDLAAGRPDSAGLQPIAEDLASVTIAVSVLFERERFRLWADLLGMFDVAEAIPGLLMLIGPPESQPDALFTAARLAGGPLVDPGWRSMVAAAAARADLDDYEQWLVRSLTESEVSLPDDLPGRLDILLVAAHRWPGSRHLRAHRVAPVVVSVTPGFPSPSEMRVLGDLAAAGAVIRRAPIGRPSSAATTGFGVVTIGTEDHGPAVTVPSVSELLWTDRLDVVQAVDDSLRDAGLRLDKTRFVQMRAASTEQANAAAGVLDIAPVGSRYKASDQGQYWAGPVAKMLRDDLSRLAAAAVARESAVSEVVRALTASVDLAEPIDVSALIESTLATLGPAQSSSELRDVVDGVVADVIGRLSPRGIRYLDAAHLMVGLIDDPSTQ